MLAGLSVASDWPRISSSLLSPYGWLDTIPAPCQGEHVEDETWPSSVVRMQRFAALGLV